MSSNSITDEWVPSDYAILKLLVAPPEGGDTLWGSGYEAYERLSPAYRELLEGLTATHQRGGFAELQKAGVVPTHTGPRGAPENTSLGYLAVHPVIRTNPVTGWKSVIANKGFTNRINELSKDVSDIVLNHLLHNRSAYHSATTDFDADLFERYGERSTSLGKRLYCDPASTSRREALGIPPPPARRAHLKSLGLLKENEAAKEKAPQTAPVPLRSKDSKLFDKVVSTRTSTYKIGDMPIEA
ncbi:UNVERIFIED_CONTAM: hypothetical protein HDU68_007835 [Siphonaria sp. JEL0065]|nr:hypothetical protein HDU68_007835 [Siphonaria sp. JEL0065]